MDQFELVEKKLEEGWSKKHLSFERGCHFPKDETGECYATLSAQSYQFK